MSYEKRHSVLPITCVAGAPRHGGNVRSRQTKLDCNNLVFSSAQVSVSRSAREPVMAQFYKWTCYGTAGVSVLIGGLQYKLLSPQVFELVASVGAWLSQTGSYNGAPSSFFNFAG